MIIPRFDAVLINGSVGAGKTTTAEALGAELERRGVPGAVIDVDALRRSWPAPRADPFRDALTLDNLRALATNYRSAGAQLLLVATVIEHRDQLERTRAALGSSALLHVRLTLSPESAAMRLNARHAGRPREREWHLRRHPELARILDRARFSDELLIDTTDRAVVDVVEHIVTSLGA